MKFTRLILAAAVMTSALFSCGQKSSKAYTFRYENDPEIKKLLSVMPDYPAVRFAVLSDPHYYDKSLGTSGEAFNAYLDEDRKLLHVSGELLDEAVKKISAEKPDFVLIPGDMTKDGEKINHEQFRKILSPMLAAVKKIFVVPGNHDVLNGGSCRYDNAKTERVDNVTPEDFKKIYADFGYAAPLYADKTSLSYLVEPVKGLWVLALDSCLWRKHDQKKHYLTDGEFSQETMKWIEEMLIKSKKENRAVIVFMHHGAVEHYPGNEKYYGEYVVNYSEQVSALFAAYGAKLIFTGHFHAQDITLKKGKIPSQFMFDIETGSPVTYPNPYRVITISADGKAKVESRFIESISSMKNGFRDYSFDFVNKGTIKLANTALKGYMVSEKDMNQLTPEIAKAYVTHISGDEKKFYKEKTSEGLGFIGRIVLKVKGGLLTGWNTDLEPDDCGIIIDLKTGSWEKIQKVQAK